jgi:hypothetical protein
MCSSAAAPIANELVKEFGVSPVQSRLPVAMFLFGLSIGSVINHLPPFSPFIVGFRAEKSHNDMFTRHLCVFCSPHFLGIASYPNHLHRYFPNPLCICSKSSDYCTISNCSAVTRHSPLGRGRNRMHVPGHTKVGRSHLSRGMF